MAEVKTKQDIILDIAEALIDAGVIDTKKFKNKVEIVGKVSAIVDKHLDEYALIKTEILSDAGRLKHLPIWRKKHVHARYHEKP